MKIIWALIFIHMSHGYPVDITVFVTFDEEWVCEIAQGEFEAKKPPGSSGYYDCLDVKP